jgi:hypothetical protein
MHPQPSLKALQPEFLKKYENFSRNRIQALLSTKMLQFGVAHPVSLNTSPKESRLTSLQSAPVDAFQHTDFAACNICSWI